MSLGRLVRGLRFLNRLRRERAVIRPIMESNNYRFLEFAQPGHFYSPIPDLDEIRRLSRVVFDRSASAIPGVDLCEASQLSLAGEFTAYYNDLPFPDGKRDGTRYFFDNEYFSYGDGVILYSMMRHFRPRRIIEVGSGFSSAAMLDVSDRFFNGRIDFTFIEPYPDRLFSLFREQDKERYRTLTTSVQEVHESLFADLQENDILFIDSSHVAKVHSDVAHILFKVLPALSTGVIVHFHDILWPFEYPQSWLEEGRAWNEAYVLRAFLQYNSSFRVLYFNSMMETQHDQFLRRELPLTMKTPSQARTPGNTSLWLRKVG